MAKGPVLFLILYWRALIMVIVPFACLPIIILNDTSEMRCLYVLLIMAAYWICEVIPMQATAFIPVVAFPILGILEVNTVCSQYYKPANIVFLGGLMIALSIEYSGLSTRIALNWLLLVGTSHRRLHLGLSLITMLISMWIVNTAATAMMLPIIDACLMEFEANDLGAMYTYPDNYAQLSPVEKAESKRPTNVTIAYYLAAAYASSLGGTGTLVGTSANLVTKGIYETQYDDDISFLAFSAYNIPPMFCSTMIMYGWLEFLYLGWLRPNSKEGQLAKRAKDNQDLIRQVIKTKLEELGRLNFHEAMVITLFVIAVTLFIFRYLGFMPGWMDLFQAKGINDAVTACFVMFMYFYVPAHAYFMHVFASGEKQPKQNSTPLLTWEVTQKKIAWGLTFLLGSGFTLAEGMKVSGLAKLLGEMVSRMADPLPQPAAQLMVMTIISFFTEFTSNVAIANIFVPIAGETCKALGWHPAYLMVPAGMVASHSYLLPVATPPNALITAGCNMPIEHMMLGGSVVKLGSLIMWWAWWPPIGEQLWGGEIPPLKKS